MSQRILAVHPGHNAGACIGDENGISYAVQEERFNLEKNYWGFPVQSIAACLAATGTRPTDLLSIAIGSTQPVARYHSREDLLDVFRRQDRLIGRLRQQIAVPIGLRVMRRFGQKDVLSALQKAGLGAVPVAWYDHHSVHAASAYFGLRRNPERDYLVLTCDGVGDGVCASVSVMGARGTERLAVTLAPNSLGGVYSGATFALGFVPLEHEYKLMGMAPYASGDVAEECAKIFDDYLGLDESGLVFKAKVPEGTLNIHRRILKDIRGSRMDYVCAGLQRFTEKLLVRWVGNAVKKTGIGDVLAAGGVFMNVKANKAIAELPEVREFEAFPSCGDETLPFGALYLEAEKRFGRREVKGLRGFYLGEDIRDDEAEQEIRKSGFRFEKPPDMKARFVDLLVSGEPVARCAGRMEYGARALGNRSILADPKNLDVVRVINRMIKSRDFWMPFAPIARASRASQYIVNGKSLESPYMMMTFDTVTDRFRDLMAAIHNADLTTRAQLLREHENPEVEGILEEFERRTGRAILLNTSFNLHGYPIVRTPKDALDVFSRSGLRYMQVGSFIVSRE